MSTWWAISQVFQQSFFIPKPKYTVEDIPDQSGKVFIVTGGNTGLGKETIKALLLKNAKVYMASRNKEKALAAIKDLKSQTGKDAIFLELDLADLKSTKEAARNFMSRERDLHVLINNAGIMFPDIKSVTKDGYDMQFGCNVLGHFLLTKELLPTMLETAKSNPPGTVRIVNLSSSTHMFARGIDYKALRASDEEARNALGTQGLYAQSKFANVVLANEFARRYGDQGIVSTSLNPGNLNTELQRHMGGVGLWILRRLIYKPEIGALTQLWAATSPETADLNGKYLIPWARLGECRPETRKTDVGTELWNWLEDEVNFL
ncbi:NAD(P)-binding protein [Schizopora paradoxa]|uniref:NAD(P)-binding protein n=1 Tax=Schizopora paradoxa TaxID=27342 RepID=A0A0H2RAW3_9AGAM|nr:NAD(P)-binding protein [Schizopora paradoxa]